MSLNIHSPKVTPRPPALDPTYLPSPIVNSDNNSNRESIIKDLISQLNGAKSLVMYMIAENKSEAELQNVFDLIFGEYLELIETDIDNNSLKQLNDKYHEILKLYTDNNINIVSELGLKGIQALEDNTMQLNEGLRGGRRSKKARNYKGKSRSKKARKSKTRKHRK